MKQTSKLWLGIGVCVTVSAGAVMALKQPGALQLPLVSSAQAANPPGSEAGEKGPSSAGGTFTGEGDFPGGLFDKALEKLMAGEGGESGLGLTKMWPRVSAPALTSEQITRVIKGNTLRINDHHALHFAASGTVEGWWANWAKLPDVAKCPKQEVVGDDYFYWDNICYAKTTVPATGKWSVRDHQLCLQLKYGKDSKDSCLHVALLLDRVALFDSSGKMEGKGNTFKPGRVLEPVAY